MTRAPILVVLLALALAACGEATPTTTTAPAAETTTTSSSATTTTDGTPTTTTTTTATTTTAAAGGSGGGECLVGEWVVGEASMNRFYEALSAEVPDLDMSAEGTTHLTFAETTYEWRPDFVLQLVIGEGLEATATTTGSITGTWTATDGVLTTTTGSSDLVVEATVMGTPMPLGPEVEDTIARSPINEATFDCGGPTPVIDFRTAEGSVPITLEPAG